MHPQLRASPDDIDPGALWAAIRGAMPRLLMAALAVGAACYVAVSLLTPRYTSQAQIEITSKGSGNPPAPRPDMGARDTAPARVGQEAIATHVRSLLSSELALKLAAELKLGERPEFNSGPLERHLIGRLLHRLGLGGPRPGETDDERMLAAYYDALRVSQTEGTPGLVVEFRAADPKLAADLANGLAELYRDMLSRPSAESRNARSAGDAGAEPIEVQIVSRARPSSEKARPQTGMITLLAMTAAMLLGVAFVLARELLAMARSAPPGEAPRTQNGLVAAARETGLEASAPVETVGSVSILARRLAARGRGRAGFRTLVTAEAPQDGAGRLAIELARKLARLGCQTILLDWSLDGVGLAEELGVSPRLGVTDVLAGRASFEDVITRLAGSEAHVIAAGSSVAGTAAARDKDRVGMLLDALDDAYEHVLITGRRDDVRDLFTTIEGRIDAGVAIADDAGEPRRGNFLGFNVAGLEVFRYEPVGEEPVASLPTPRRALS